ncbi:Crp/Fnr family transcriptional regulator [Reichenbachiella carrageenanivorans]|uniref:Crp/Fnr family transcriptional regulator n=1 Tax=Reichenbachiella carrageenanivorans TaxID=2979869 RepID=A0ABY6CV33_9BACT|nr:Crp/Fnr family transcriptional regulator [Reichenbachiella carrageenanivorans]UXX77787.1 Crp/Fnr family transcriptional regulator [Reichenbachiella carrageenanivorans]
MNKINIKKKQILQRKGSLHSQAYIVESGLLRSYTIDKNGKEHIFMFGPEGWIVTDYAAADEPCDLYIDALEDSVVIQIKKNTELEIDHKKIIKRIRVLQRRVIMLMSASAIERYNHFVSTYPTIVQRVPQYMIASYLGITPEALSAAKSQHLKHLK